MVVHFSIGGMRGPFLAGAALAVMSGVQAWAEADAANVPAPPGQTQPWTPSATTLPSAVVDAVTQLFKDGLPDPRGCEYREIEIAETKTWTFKTKGWLLPGAGAQKYAIAWNGVIYPVLSVGAPVDLAKEIAAIPADQHRFRGYGVGWPMSDQLSANVEIGALPIHVAFLLRLGEGKLAAEMWEAGYAGQGDLPAPDPYVDIAGVWLDRSFNRAVQDFLNHDDAAALAICRQLSPVVARARASAVARGISDPWPAKRYGTELWQLPVLEADLEQRTQERASTPVVESGASTSGPARIAALIHDLENSYAEQFMNPGETDITNDATVQELTREGPPAVEPLLKCLVEDNRLTRARFTQGMGRAGPIIPVYEAAYKALFRILNVSFPLFDSDSQDYRQQKEPRAMSPEDRKALAAKLEKVWDKIKDHGPAESGYLTLQDDTASPKDWFRAIDNICQPANGNRTSYVLIPPQGGYSIETGAFKAYGDSLHAKTNPSVSDLIIKRFEELVQRKPNGDFDLPQLGKMLLALADWDGKAHLADLGRLGLEYDARFVHETGVHSSDINSFLVEKRLQLGDATALADYVGYIQDLKSDELKKTYGPGPHADFSILWHYPDDPGARQAAEKLFSGKDALLVPIPRALVPSPLIGLPAFRRELLRGLGDKSPAGTVTVRDGALDYSFTATNSTMSTSPGFDPSETDKPKVGDVIPFRLCDDYAYALANIAGFPACKLYWPEAKRDSAVAACRALLAQYGDALRGRPSDPYDDGAGYSPDSTLARFRLEPLDHPATPEDVKAGRALFSLTGTVRAWKMPSYPLGSAWQAEEVQVDGKWRRYFGVFQDGAAVKVAAADLEFPNLLYNAAVITPHLYAVLDAPEEIDHSRFTWEYAQRNFTAIGAPVPVNVDIANHNGEDQVVPPALVLPPGAKGMLPAGLTLVVSYSAKVPPRIKRFTDPPFDFGTFQDLPLRAGVAVAAAPAAGPVLGPEQKLTLLRGDLREYFDLTRPGTYHLHAKFHLPGDAPSETAEQTFFIGSP